MTLLTFFYSFIVVLFGAAIGSFLSVVIPRLKIKEKGIIKGRSKCPHCKKTLGIRELIPIVSYMLLKGKCRYCGKKIGLWYPTIEFFTALSFLIIFWYLDPLSMYSGPTFGQNPQLLALGQNPQMFTIGQNSELLTWITLILYFIYAAILITTFFYDLKYMEIPDAIVIPGIILALTATILPTTPNTIDALLGSLIPLLFFGLQIVISKGQWIGGGDLRIGAFMGLILGWKLTILALILSYLIGAVVSIIIIITEKGGLKTRIPFGPFLALATFASLLSGNTLIEWYLQLILF